MRFGPAVALIFLACLFWFRPVLPSAPGAQFLSAHTWDSAGIGGLSGLAVTNAGKAALILVDKAELLDARLERDGGMITAVTVQNRHILVENIKAKGAKFDTEGLALAPDGTVFISYEQDQRLRRYDLATGQETAISTPPDFAAFGKNSGLEALARQANGHLLTLPEVPVSRRAGFPLWRWDGTAWERIAHLPARDGFLAVGADIGPGGSFYLLERRMTVFGFQSRIRRWDMDTGLPTNERSMLTTPAGMFANLEGLSLWQDAAGGWRATMVADDNFWPIMRTQIVEYAITE